MALIEHDNAPTPETMERQNREGYATVFKDACKQVYRTLTKRPPENFAAFQETLAACTKLLTMYEAFDSANRNFQDFALKGDETNGTNKP